MTVTTKSFALLAGIGSLLLGACRDGKPGEHGSSGRNPSKSNHASSDSVRVAAATHPVAWLGCQLVGDPCEPVALVPPGASAHSWEPKPSDLQRLESASIFLRSGLAFEDSWIPRFQSTLPSLQVVDARGGLDLRSEEPDHGRHRPGGAARSGEESDPHVWSSPRAMDRMADTLAARWTESDPELGKRIAAHLPTLHRRLLELDTAVRGLLAPFSGKTFLVNHPGLGYLARDYGLIQKALESHGQELTPVAVWEVRKVAKSQGIKAVFVQSEYSRRTADQIARELGLQTIDVDLLAPAPYDSLYLACARAMAEKL